VRFLSPLVRATLARRYKRFLCDAVLASGERVTAHCPNPGAMLGVAEPGSEIWLQPAATETRRLAYTWELIRVGRGLVGINAQNPNTIVAEALAQRRIDALAGYDHIQREVRVGDASRLDFRLTAAARPECYVEVKNVHLSRVHGLAEFPDSVTDRGRKHLGVLAQAAQARGDAVPGATHRLRPFRARRRHRSGVRGGLGRRRIARRRGSVLCLPHLAAGDRAGARAAIGIA